MAAVAKAEVGMVGNTKMGILSGVVGGGSEGPAKEVASPSQYVSNAGVKTCVCVCVCVCVLCM